MRIRAPCPVARIGPLGGGCTGTYRNARGQVSRVPVAPGVRPIFAAGIRRWLLPPRPASRRLSAAATCVDPATLAHLDRQHHEVLRRQGQQGGCRFAGDSRHRLVPVSNVDRHRGTCRHGYGPFRPELETSRHSGGREQADRLTSAFCAWRARTPRRSPCSNCAPHFPVHRACSIRMEPLAPEERVVSLAYPGSRLRLVGGRFVQYGDSDKLAGTALLEMYDGDDRLVLDHGASGAPVLDCAGPRGRGRQQSSSRKRCEFLSSAIRISTAWGAGQRRVRAHSGAEGFSSRTNDSAPLRVAVGICALDGPSSKCILRGCGRPFSGRPLVRTEFSHAASRSRRDES